LDRRVFIAGAGAGLAAPGIARAAGQDEVRSWRMVTSWPKGFPGPGTGADRLSARIETMSAGRLRIKVYGAGELVPALEVFDAVAGGAIEVGHSASFFWRGKSPASVFFTTVPFGLTAVEHSAWIHHGGGQALWDELYAPFGLKPFMAGNSGMGMGGWFKREVRDLDDLRGLKYRIPGLGAEVLRRLGAVPVLLPPSEILPALQSGAVDGAEFLGPWSDLAAGFHKVAAYYYWPGFHEPNGTAECIVNAKAWAELPEDLRAIVANACEAESSVALAETEWRNGEALATLVETHGVQSRSFPEPVLRAARNASFEVLEAFAATDSAAGRIYASFAAARERAIGWAAVSREAFLVARRAGREFGG
jgi:TRAP-type mannitol/chloroaromatic compound transport system substrate-binding protein